MTLHLRFSTQIRPPVSSATTDHTPPFSKSPTITPVEAIAEQAGSVDGSHLHHSFLRQYGCTPGHYRKQSR